MDCVKPDEDTHNSIGSTDSCKSFSSIVLEKVSKNKIIMTFIGLVIVAIQSYLANFKS